MIIQHERLNQKTCIDYPQSLLGRGVGLLLARSGVLGDEAPATEKVSSVLQSKKQSIKRDIRERFRQHIKSSLTSGPTTNKLYQQMKKYGPENFTFEILEIVDRGKLNERETYWIDFYKTKEYGLNGTKGNANTI